jgi:peptide-methionine (S)-S-oxide reductase
VLRDRAEGPYPPYFARPRLLWFVANNPNLIETMPPNIVAVTRALLAHGAEQEDLDYTLALVMTSAPAREQGHQRPLIATLLAAGAMATPDAVTGALAHGELDAVEAVGAAGAPVAAAFGRTDELRRLLTPEDIQLAFGLAVINDRAEAARVALDAGADVNAFLPVHAHSTALHQAVLHDDVALLELLIDRGAQTDARDTLWNGTPLDWAIHERRPRAAAYLTQ